ncbi:MAG: universal stress protein [Desulfobacula sp.]|jgi:nucleotide-binding universal stress UspA family protein|uniref:universal stress protein n=1 Tax=Desulfobacula sp. TaxID=2593537 RepID=UPI001E01529C|nr:universal stress protein [Desulfobacula sp.]MBT3486220.1 universal stress protein [Desulfobacula sp.]MBT3803580.1 universal stress protein [Desulfobacula sp.]MBT4025718.1 universal stress protein [Desulfobacula sp.]MBT4199188.1 universal stress protein [Desulfobacula sp.]
MVPKIKKILYATDLSDSARNAFGYAADLAQRYGAMITILYVMENMSHIVETEVKEMVGQKEWDKLKSERLNYVTKKIKSRLEDFCQEMNSEIDSCRLLVEDVLVIRGNPPEEILTVSKDINADMIVMGSYGHNILKDAFIGGTARKVVKKSSTPVLVVRLPKN